MEVMGFSFQLKVNKLIMNIFIAGHKGMVGSAIHKKLLKNASSNIIVSSKKDLNLLDQNDVNLFFKKNNIDQVYLAAAKVGGIHANNEYPAQFIYENLTIQSNIINASHIADVQKLLFLGSSCIYPKHSSQPIKEEYLLNGRLEPTNEPYAIAKIAGIKLCESYNRQYGRDYRSIMPTNLYGPNDNFHQENSHVIPALIRRFHNAIQFNKKEVVIWGSGEPKREFLHVDDMASASIYVMNIENKLFTKKIDLMSSHINIGTGQDCSIMELAHTIADIVNFKGKIVFDKSKPDGTPRKLLDISKINDLGWNFSINLYDGLQDTYSWFKKNTIDVRL
jgi:GDP-L-fucose synthase